MAGETNRPADEGNAYGSYHQTAVVTPVAGLPVAAGGGVDDEAMAQRLQEQEFRRAQEEAVPRATALPVQNAQGTQYVAMYPPSGPDIRRDMLGVGVAGTFIAPHEQRLLEAHSLGRTVKVLALLDGIILFLNSVWFPILFLMAVWAPLSGWMAGSRFSLVWTYAYAFYYLLRICLDVVYIFTGYPIFIFLLVINIIIARYIMRFAQVVKSLSPAEVQQLRSPEGVWAGQPQPFIIL